MTDIDGSGPAADAVASLNAFLAKYEDAIVAQALRARKTMHQLFSGAVELVYDNYNALVFAYGPSERASEAICSIALYPRWITLFFARGNVLDDPEELLEGSGKTVRGIRLADAKTLDHKAVRALIAQAIGNSKAPLSGKKRVTTVIRSVSPKQRARRPSKKAKVAKKATKRAKKSER